MSAWDLVVVLCALLALASACVMSLVTARLLTQMRQLDTARQEFQDQITPLVEQLGTQIHDAQIEIDRVGKIIDTATAINDRVDHASDATFRALSAPVIKGVALASGTRKVAKALRGDDGGQSRKERAS